jgi:hypothetical protein
MKVIANVLLDEAVAIVVATGDHADLVRLADCSIGVKEALAQIGRTATEDEVVAVLDLREEQSVLAARMLSFSCGEEGLRREIASRVPFLGIRKPLAFRRRDA